MLEVMAYVPFRHRDGLALVEHDLAYGVIIRYIQLLFGERLGQEYKTVYEIFKQIQGVGYR